MIPALFTSIFDLVTGWLNGRKEIQQQKIQTQKAAEENKARLLAETASHNSAWEMASLTGGDKIIKRVSFVCFTAPFVVAIFAPNAVQEYFNVAIYAIPDWYKGTYMAITGSVWGISALKDPVSQIVNQFKKK